MKERESIARKIKEDFDPNYYLVVHWDGKQIKHNTSISSTSMTIKVHLPVVVSESAYYEY